jgi:hypothetical protein
MQVLLPAQLVTCAVAITALPGQQLIIMGDAVIGVHSDEHAIGVHSDEHAKDTGVSVAVVINILRNGPKNTRDIGSALGLASADPRRGTKLQPVMYKMLKRGIIRKTAETNKLRFPDYELVGDMR